MPTARASTRVCDLRACVRVCKDVCVCVGVMLRLWSMKAGCNNTLDVVSGGLLQQSSTRTAQPHTHTAGVHTAGGCALVPLDQHVSAQSYTPTTPSAHDDAKLCGPSMLVHTRLPLPAQRRALIPSDPLPYVFIHIGHLCRARSVLADQPCLPKHASHSTPDKRTRIIVRQIDRPEWMKGQGRLSSWR